MIQKDKEESQHNAMNRQLKNQWIFIDFNDTSDYKVAMILEFNTQNQVKIRLDGYASRSDETISSNDSRMQPFRKFTNGYTGSYKQSYRQSWSVSLSKIESLTNKLDNFFIIPLNHYDVKRFNQQFRGAHFLYADYLMAQSSFCDKQTFQAVINYLYRHLDYAKKLFQQFDCTFSKFDQQNFGHLQHILNAYYASYYESFQTIISIFGGNRSVNFYKSNKVLFQQINAQLKTNEIPTNQNIIVTIFGSYFKSEKVLNSLLDLIQRLEVTKTFIPFLFLKMLMNLLNTLIRYFSLQLSQCRQQVYQIILQNVQKLNETNVKDLSRTIISDTIRYAKIMFSDDQLKIKQLETRQCIVCYKFFSSIKLEHKISAITYASEILTKARSTTHNEYKYLKEDMLFQQFYRIGLIAEILKETNHPQVLKRAIELFVLFCKNQSPLVELFSMVFDVMNTTQDKTVHLIMSNGLQKMIDTISNDNFDVVKRFYQQKLKSINYQKWNQTHLKLVYTFLKKKGVNQELLDLYEYIRLSNNQEEIRILQEMVRNNEQILQQLLTICYQKIKSEQQIDLHVELLKQLLSAPQETSYKQEYKDIVINSILNHRPDEDDSLFHSKLELVNYFFFAYEKFVTITMEQFFKIYQKLKTNAVYLTRFKDFIIQQTKTEKFICGFLSKIKQDLFQELFCKMPLKQVVELNQQMYRVFEICFIDINYTNKTLTGGKSLKKIKLVNPNLIGLEKLEQIFFNNRNQEVVLQSCQLICNLHVKVTNDLEQHKTQIQKNLVQKVVQVMKSEKSKQNVYIVQKCLFLLQKLYHILDGKPQLKTPVLNSHHYLIFNVINKEKNLLKKIKINQKQYIDRLKQQIINNFQAFDFTVNTLFYNEQPVTNKTKTLGQLFSNNNNEQIIIQVVFKDKPVNVVKNYLIDDYLFLASLLQTSASELAWKLLRSIRTPQKATQQFAKQSLATIANKLKNGNIYQRLYLVQVGQKLPPEWWKNFILKGYLLKLVQSVSIQIKQSLESNYLYFVLFIVRNHYFLPDIRENWMTQREGLSQKLTYQQQQEIVCHHLNKCFTSHIQNIMNSVYYVEEEYDYYRYIVRFFFDIIKICKKYHIILQKLTIKSLIKYGLVGVNNSKKDIKDAIFSELLHAFVDTIDRQVTKQFVCDLFGEYLNFVLEQKVDFHNNYYYYLSQILKIMKDDQRIYLVQKMPNIFYRILNILKKTDPELRGYEHQYMITNGLVLILKELVSKTIIVVDRLQRQKIIFFIVNQCLFNFKQTNTKCNYPSTRINLFRLTVKLAQPYPDLLLDVIQFIRNILSQGNWRQYHSDYWEISSSAPEKILKYAGLVNLACICYINSFVQQLFMIPSFRQALISCQDPQKNKLQQIENPLRQLQNLFINLKYTDQLSISPANFCLSFKNYQGNPINIYQQMDIDEFSSVLFDKLENQIKGTKSENIIKDHFGGTFSNQIICKGCPHFSSRQQPFLSIPLQVKSSIEQSLQQMVSGQTLQGQNAYFCDTCNKKVDSTKRISLKTLPNHLILVLKRIQFNYSNFTKHKINDRCEFPLQLNLKPYSNQQLKSTSHDTNSDFPLLPDQYFDYELKGVVVHSGFADNGHYYSFVQQRQQKQAWFDFNDIFVNSFDINLLPDEAFGTQSGRLRDKNKNAYLLIYDRKVKFDSKQQIITNTVNNVTPEPEIVNYIKRMQIQNQNSRIQKFVFSMDLEDFCFKELMCIISKQENQNVKQYLKFIVLYFLTVYIRKHDGENIHTYIEILIREIQKLELQYWVIKELTTKSLIKQLFLTNSENQTRKYLSIFIHQLYIGSMLRQSEQEYVLRQKFVQSIVDILEDKTVLNKFQSDELCWLLYRIFQKQASVFHNKRNFLLKLVQNLNKDAEESNQSEIQQDCDLFDDASSYFGFAPIRCVGLQNNKPSRTYVWALMKQLLHNLNQQNVWNQFGITNIQFQFGQATSKAGIHYLSDYLAYVSQQKDGLVAMVEFFSNFEPKITLDEIRQFMMLTKKLLLIQDQLQNQRANQLAKIVFKIIENMSQSQSSLTQMDTLIQWVIKLSRNIPIFKHQLRDVKQNFLSILKNKAPASQNILKKNAKMPPLKQGVVRVQHMIHGIMFPINKKQDRQLTHKMINNFENIQYLDHEDWDIDGGFADQPLDLNQKISIFILGKKGYVEARVEKYFLQRILVKYTQNANVQNSSLLFWRDSDQLAQYHSLMEQQGTEPISAAEESLDPTLNDNRDNRDSNENTGHQQDSDRSRDSNGSRKTSG